jgi:hypothetical protein
MITWIRSSQALLGLAMLVSFSASAAMFTPGVPCNGCDLEIFDHGGVMPTSKNAVFRVQNPQTPNGSAPYIELYNPTLAVIQDCAQKVQSVQGNPGSVRMRASEYRLAGSNQVVFLVKDCQLLAGPGPGAGPGSRTGPGPMSGSESSSPSGCTMGDRPVDTSCSTSGGGWQTVGRVLSEPCQLSYDDVSGSGGRQMVIYDNTMSVACVNGNYEPSIYVGATPSDSNWGAFVSNTMNCTMKTGVRPSDGARVVEKIVCPISGGGGMGPGPEGDGSGGMGRTEPMSCASGDLPTDTSCVESGTGWQTVGNPLSEACQLSYDDVSGSGARQMVIYDNTYSVACVGGVHESGIYVGATPSDSNWGGYVANPTNCRMKTGVRPSDGARVVEKIICP